MEENRNPRGRLRALAARIARMDIPIYAANAGFFLVLSLFPALLLVLSLLQRSPLQIGDLLELVRSFLPEALAGSAEEIIFSTYRSAPGAVAGVAGLTALWSSSRGIYGLITGLNAVYGLQETRSGLVTRAVSFFYAAVFYVLVLLTLLLQVFGSFLLERLQGARHPLLQAAAALPDLQLLFLTAVQTLVFTLMYAALPSRRNSFRESLPGAIVASVGWMVFSRLFSLYVEHFPRYALVYGSLYGIALGMLWIYCCVSLFFYGGALNRLLAQMEKLL